MRLKGAELNNIRNHRDRNFDFAPVTVVTGPNDSGKSTIRDAIEACLCGTYTHMHGTGNAKIRELLTEGEAKGSVTLLLDGGRRVSRNTDGGLALSWAQRAKATEAQLELERAMGCTLDKARLALSGMRFFRMEAKEQKALLQDMLGLELTPDQVEAELTQRGADCNLTLLDVFRRFCGRDKTALVSFARSHKQLYEERTFQKKDLQRLVGEERTLEKQIQEQVFVSDTAKTQAERALSEAEMREARLLERKGRIEQARSQVEKLRVQLQAMEHGTPTTPHVPAELPSEDELQNRITACEQRLAALKGEQRQVQEWAHQEAQAERSIQSFTEEIQSYERALENLACGNCGYPLPGANERKAETERRLLRAQDKLSGAVRAKAEARQSRESHQTIEQYAERIAKGTQILGNLRGQLELRQSHARAVERHQGHAALVSASRRSLEAAEAELAALGTLEETLAQGLAATEAIHEARRILREYAEYQGVHRQLEQVRDKVRQSTETVSCLELLVPFFAPDGFQLEHTRGALGGFESLLNRWLSRVDLQGRFSADLVIEVSRRGGAFVPYSRCADSGYLLTGLALQLAFAQYTGLGIVCLDRLESLDPQRRESLLHLCVDLTQGEEHGPDQIFLFGAVPNLQVPAGVKHIDLAQVPAEVA